MLCASDPQKCDDSIIFLQENFQPNLNYMMNSIQNLVNHTIIYENNPMINAITADLPILKSIHLLRSHRFYPSITTFMSRDVTELER